MMDSMVINIKYVIAENQPLLVLAKIENNIK